MRPAAVAVDVDGTITDMSKNLECNAMEALRQVHSEGTPVILTTGNVLPIAYGLSRFIGLDGTVVAENGGVVCHEERIEVMGDPEAPRKAWEHLRTKLDLKKLFTDHWRVSEVALRTTVEPQWVIDELKDFPVQVQSTGFAIHIMQPTHCKMNGLRKIAEMMGVDVKGIASIGDSDNDVSMLRDCPRSFAVGNATPAAKEAAAEVMPGKHGEGVVQALEALGLLGSE